MIFSKVNFQEKSNPRSSLTYISQIDKYWRYIEIILSSVNIAHPTKNLKLYAIHKNIELLKTEIIELLEALNISYLALTQIVAVKNNIDLN